MCARWCWLVGAFIVTIAPHYPISPPHHLAPPPPSPLLNKKPLTPSPPHQAIKENTAGAVQPSLAAQVLVVSATLGPPGATSILWTALTTAATSTTAAAAAAPRFPPSVLLHCAVAELVALGSTDACMSVMQWVADAGVVPHAHGSAFAWQLVGALMEAQQVAVAVQACSHAHDMGVLGCYVLPVHVPVITAAQGGTIRCVVVVLCGGVDECGCG